MTEKGSVKQEGFITLNRVPTRVISFGRWIEEKEPGNPEDLIILIPGNSGVTRSYETFLKLLHESLGWTVWAVSHGGHELPDERELYEFPNLKENPELYTLEAAIDIKKDFFKKYVPKNARVRIVAHSIGSYITTKLLKEKEINKQVVGTYLLFPVLEEIGSTPNGRQMLWDMPFRFPAGLFFAWIFTLLPRFMQNYLTYCHVSIQGFPDYQTDMIRRFVDPEILEKVFFMTRDVLYTVKERETDVIKQNVDKICMYYGNKDDWCPKSHYDKITEEIPGIKAVYKEDSLDHAFCLRHSQEVAQVVLEWIKES